MNNLYLCWNCLSEPNEDGKRAKGRAFEGDKPVCPQCGVDGGNPRYARLVEPRETIHFDPPDPIAPVMGVGKAACDGRAVGGRVFASGERTAVTCPKCRESEPFKGDAQFTSVLAAV